MRKRLFVALAFLIIGGFSLSTAFAQLPINIPRVPKPNKPQPQPAASAQPKPTSETQPRAQPQPDTRSTTSSAPAATGQDQLGIVKDSLQITALTRNFYRKSSDMWSWVPYFRYSVTRNVGSGDQTYVEYTIPGAGTAMKFDCELNQRGDGFECGGRQIPDDKTSTYTGPVNFAIKIRNELEGTDTTLFTGRMKVAKTRSNGAGPKAANEWVYYVDHDWNLPIGYIFYTQNAVHGWDYPTFNVGFWVRGELGKIEPHLFYQGKEIGRVFNDGILMGGASCRARVENETTHIVNDAMPQRGKWSRVECDFPMVKGWDKAGENQNDVFKMAANPGEYEFKVLWKNKLARSIKFTVGPDGKLENGIAPANKLGSGRVIVPVTIIGDQDGQWDKTAWKTEAFYGNPLTGFTAAQ